MNGLLLPSKSHLTSHYQKHANHETGLFVVGLFVGLFVL